MAPPRPARDRPSLHDLGHLRARPEHVRVERPRPRRAAGELRPFHHRQERRDPPHRAAGHPVPPHDRPQLDGDRDRDGPGAALELASPPTARSSTGRRRSTRRLHLVRWLKARYGDQGPERHRPRDGERQPATSRTARGGETTTPTGSGATSRRSVAAFVGSPTKASNEGGCRRSASASGRASAAARWSRSASEPSRVRGAPRSWSARSTVTSPRGGRSSACCATAPRLPPSLALWTVKTVNPDGNRAEHAPERPRRRPQPELLVRLGALEPRPAATTAAAPVLGAGARAVRRLVRRVRPDVSIWYHQPWGAVLRDPCHGPNRIQRRYAASRGCRSRAAAPGSRARRSIGRTTARAARRSSSSSGREGSRATVARRNARAALRVAAG